MSDLPVLGFEYPDSEAMMVAVKEATVELMIACRFHFEGDNLHANQERSADLVDARVSRRC